MTELHIPNNDREHVRVFAVNRAPQDMLAEIDTHGKASLIAAFLGQPIPQSGFELFPVADLSGVGLSGYLIQGFDVPPEQLLDGARAKLDGLDGFVLLVFSGAFEGKETTLHLSSDITHIGTYGEAQPNMQNNRIESDAAQAYTGVPRMSPATPPRGKAGSAMVTLGLVVILGLALWWALR